MDCSTSQGLMLEFVEGTLPSTLTAAMKRHIEQCPACMQELETQSSRTRALKKLGRVSAPDQWTEISRSIRRAGWAYYLTRYGLPAAAFGVAAAAAVFLFQSLLTASSPANDYAAQRANVAFSPSALAAETVVRPETQSTAARSLGTPADAAAVGDATDDVTGLDEAFQIDTAHYDALEADHYDKMVEQFLGDTAGLPAVQADSGS